MPPKSVCVYCGSRVGSMPGYAMAARDFGAALAAEGWRLVYGAGDIGLMGEVARAAQNAGGETFGVIPVHLMDHEVGKTDLTRFVVTETMHERKKVMLMNADAVVLLPGGAGSLDEVFEALTWRQLGLHDKPVIILNTEGYWTPFLTLIDHVIAQGFAAPSFSDYMTVVETPQEAVAALQHVFADAAISARNN